MLYFLRECNDLSVFIKYRWQLNSFEFWNIHTTWYYHSTMKIVSKLHCTMGQYLQQIVIISLHKGPVFTTNCNHFIAQWASIYNKLYKLYANCNELLDIFISYSTKSLCLQQITHRAKILYFSKFFHII